MMRLRNFAAATLLLLGFVYIFKQLGSMSLSAGLARSHDGPSRSASHALDSAEQQSSHGSEKTSLGPLLKTSPEISAQKSKTLLSLPTLSGHPLPAAESASIVIDLPNGYDFQQDLTLKLPIESLRSLSKYAPHNYKPGEQESYTYATFFASRNPSVQDPYYLAVHSLIYRILWSKNSKTSKYPFLVFVGDFVSTEQRLLLAGAGAIVRELAPLPWNPTDPGVVDRWKDLFAKLHMWNETDFDRILFLDADALPIAPIDDMFSLKKVRKCIESKLQLDDFLPGGEPVCEPYIFAGVPHDPFSIFDANINVGSMVFTPNTKQHQRLLQNYLKFDKYDVKMAEQAFLNWQFGINSAYPPDMLGREYGAFFPDPMGEKGLKVIHEKIWVEQGGFWKEGWEQTWQEMLAFYGSSAFEVARKADSELPV